MNKPEISLGAIEPFFEKLEKLNKLHRILICSGVLVLTVGLFVYLAFMPKRADIKKHESKLESLEKELSVAKRNAKDLKTFQKKISAAESQFKIVMRSLPEKKEIPSLLESISQSGRDSGLEIQLFQPLNEKRRDFYAEIPVSMRVQGKYHNTVLFFDRVARLSRVVNLKDIAMKPSKGGKLTTSCKAVTYKFVQPKPKKKKKKKKSKRRK